MMNTTEPYNLGRLVCPLPADLSSIPPLPTAYPINVTVHPFYAWNIEWIIALQLYADEIATDQYRQNITIWNRTPCESILFIKLV